jgi:hypothetical protein
MPKLLTYAAFFAGVPLLGAIATQALTARGVSKGVTRFVSSTIGALAIFIYWVYLRNL